MPVLETFVSGLRDAVRTLHAVGILEGTFDETRPSHPRVPCVKHPGDSVERWYEDKQGIFGGISVAPLDTLKGICPPVDVLLGWLDPVSHTFRWAFGDRVICVPLQSHDMVHVALIFMHMATSIPLTSQPVWLTIGDIDLRDAIRDIPRDDFPSMTDLVNDVIAAERRAAFWDRSREEFIQKTWAPSRLVSWCLDHDDVMAFTRGTYET